MIHQKKINLDITNIKEVPIKFIYIFYISLSGFNSLNQLENKLNNFICTKNLNNPFSFDINAYMNKRGKRKIKYIFEGNKICIIHDCIKFSDYFFTFYFDFISENTIYSVNGVIRIDCIYSENFDRIFIGIVEKDEKSYAKTFEFNMNNIDKFFLQNFKNFNSGFDLKVMFKDKQIQDIWPLINKDQYDLEGLDYLLNEKLIYNL